MFTLFRGGKVYAPDALGKVDVLIAGEKIAYLAPQIEPPSGVGPIDVVDVTDRLIGPGLIDQHVHLTGGGGEGGFVSRTPEVVLSRVTRAGITTVVGCLGVDGTTRSMAGLLAKARGLEDEGISTYIYTGAYEVPTRTITGSVRSDLVLIDKVIGAGEIAISDHRSAQPSREEIRKLAAECRVGGMLGGKAGVLHLHVGNGKNGLGMLFEIVEESDIPISQFVPTHVNRDPVLFESAVRWGRQGGIIDITSGVNPDSGTGVGIKPSRAIRLALEKGVSIENISMSSDGNGSVPRFDERGRLQSLLVASPDSLCREFRDLVRLEGIALPEALKVVTATVAKILRLFPHKGAIAVGSDADLVVFDQELAIDQVWAKGRLMVREGKPIVRGTFEE